MHCAFPASFLGKIPNTPKLLPMPGKKNFRGRYWNFGISVSISVRGSQPGAFCPQANLICYLELKLRCLKNLKLFQSELKKKSYEPNSSAKKATAFWFFFFISVFLRNRSLSNASWLQKKKTQNWEGKSVFNWKSIKQKRNMVSGI